MAHSQSSVRLFRLITLSLLGQLSCTPLLAANFFNFNLFQGVNIESSDHQGSNMQEVNFQGTKMSRANFQNANLSRAIFKEADMKEANFQGANLSGANLLNANAARVNFLGARIDSANLQNAKMAFANFQDTNLQNSSFQESDLRKANFQGANLTRTIFQSADLYQVSFQGAKIISTNLQGAAMELSSFQDAEIQDANFKGVNMKESNFRNAYIHPISAADTSYTPFGCVPISLRAKVQRDDAVRQSKQYDEKWKQVTDKVASINLDTETCTEFEDSSFKDAILHNVNFSNPDHFKISNLTVAQLCRAISLYGSTFPQTVMAEIKKDKACERKLTDKALFDQARDDFLRVQKNNQH